MPTSEEIIEKAKRTKEKKASLGPDIDLSNYSSQARELPEMDLSSLSRTEQERMAQAGMNVTGKSRSGTFVQMDHSVVYAKANQDGVEVLSADEALMKYDWLKDYWWKAVPVDADRSTSQAELKWTKGYFIRALPGVKSIFPLQACLFLSQDGIAQNVHNVIIVEPGAELDIIAGCAVGYNVKSGLHVGISEFYVKEGGKLTFTMIHNWSEGIAVRPRSAAIIEDGGLFLSNYICLQPVNSLQMYPTAYLDGKDAVARFNSILLATPGSLLDVGARVFLRQAGTRTEIISRAVTKGGKIWARGHLIGEAPNIKAHLACNGLILDEKGFIHAIPELEGHNKDVEMSHEAAIGKIAKDEITYLMARGLSEEEATAAIVRGFLNVKIEGLPSQLQEQLDDVAKYSEKYML